MSEGKFINWGTGGFGAGNWKIVYDLIRKYDVKTVIEYGCGVSTELLMAVGCVVTSLETQREYADIPGANIIVAPYGQFPEDIGRFDLAFIDGPGAYEFEVRGVKPERRFSAYHAKRHANLVYLHDGGLEQEEAFADWEKLGGHDTDLIYRKRA